MMRRDKGEDNCSTAKPLYGLTPVPRVRILPSPPDVLSPVFIRIYLISPVDSNHINRGLGAVWRCMSGAYSRDRSNCYIASANFGISGLNVAALRYRHVGMPQDFLDSFVGNSKAVKICR